MTDSRGVDPGGEGGPSCLLKQLLPQLRHRASWRSPIRRAASARRRPPSISAPRWPRSARHVLIVDLDPAGQCLDRARHSAPARAAFDLSCADGRGRARRRHRQLGHSAARLRALDHGPARRRARTRRDQPQDLPAGRRHPAPGDRRAARPALQLYPGRLPAIAQSPDHQCARRPPMPCWCRCNANSSRSRA